MNRANIVHSLIVYHINNLQGSSLVVTMENMKWLISLIPHDHADLCNFVNDQIEIIRIIQNVSLSLICGMWQR